MTTENIRHGVIELTAISADWDYRASVPTGWPNHPRIMSMQFNPAASGDKIYVRDEDENGPVVFEVTADSSDDQRIKYFHGTRAMPYVDFSECILTAGHKLIIDLWREP